MLGEPEYNMNELFAQLGLDSSDAAIDSFIENNQLDRLEVLLQSFAHEYGDLIYNRGAKIIYGCTHYPLLEGLFNRVFGDRCVSIDPATAVGNALKYQLMQNDMLRMDKSPSVKFLDGMAFQWSDCLALKWSDCLA